MDSDLARLASACINHVLQHTDISGGGRGDSDGGPSTRRATAAASAGAGVGGAGGERLGADEVVEFAVDVVPLLVACLLPYVCSSSVSTLLRR